MENTRRVAEESLNIPRHGFWWERRHLFAWCGIWGHCGGFRSDMRFPEIESELDESLKRPYTRSQEREEAMREIRGFLAALSALLIAAPAAAQTSYPDKPVRIIVGFTAG